MILYFLLSAFIKRPADITTGQSRSQNDSTTGNGNNTESRHSEDPDVVELLPPIVKLNQQIKDLKLKLYRTKVKGIMKRDEQNQQIDDLRMDIFEKRTKLMKQGSDCQSYIPFQEYIRIIQSTFQSTRSPIAPAESIIPKDGAAGPSISHHSTDVVPLYYQVAYSIFAFFEAYLLKRLHLVMLQQNQQQIHRKTWSNSVAQLFLEISPLKKQFQTTVQDLEIKLEQMKESNKAMQEVYTDHVRIQEKTIMKLEEAPWYEDDDFNSNNGDGSDSSPGEQPSVHMI